jgi:hypothetical protein
VPPIVGWQEDPVRFVVGGDDDAAAVERAVFAKIFSSTRSRSGGAAM